MLQNLMIFKDLLGIKYRISNLFVSLSQFYRLPLALVLSLFIAGINRKYWLKFKMLLYEQSPKYVGALVKALVVAEVLVLFSDYNGHPSPGNLNIRY